MKNSPEDLATLLAIVIAAHRSNNKALERQMRQCLLDEHGVRISFVRRSPSTGSPDTLSHPAQEGLKQS